MTEAEWLNCEDPTRMLEFLRGKASERKLRLFACACCRMHDWIANPRNASAVEKIERCADRGRAVKIRLTTAPIQIVVLWTADLSPSDAATRWATARDYQGVVCRADLLRCIINNPFRPVSIDSAWLTWNCRTIPKLARCIYDDRAFDLLPILADALEEAGCMNKHILQHCRQSSEHVRGCWVIDLLLGKE